MTTDNVTVKKFDYRILMVLGLIIFAAFAVFLIIKIQSKTSQLDSINTTLRSTEQKANFYLDLSDKKENNLNILKAELEQTESRLESIKDKDELLKQDIELYIKTSFKRVPKVVAKTIAKTIVENSSVENISPELLMGIIQVESKFDPSAVGPKTKYGSARGLMQVMPEWAKKFNLESKYSLHDIDTNIECGIKVFKIHLEEGNGDISEGLYLYVNKDRDYVDKVYIAMGKFISFRATVDNKKTEMIGIKPKEEEEKIGTNTGATKSS